VALFLIPINSASGFINAASGFINSASGFIPVK
jgi:hypothetical protein